MSRVIIYLFFIILSFNAHAFNLSEFFDKIKKHRPVNSQTLIKFNEEMLGPVLPIYSKFSYKPNEEFSLTFKQNQKELTISKDYAHPNGEFWKIKGTLKNVRNFCFLFQPLLRIATCPQYLEDIEVTIDASTYDAFGHILIHSLQLNLNSEKLVKESHIQLSASLKAHFDLGTNQFNSTLYTFDLVLTPQNNKNQPIKIHLKQPVEDFYINFNKDYLSLGKNEIDIFLPLPKQYLKESIRLNAKQKKVEFNLLNSDLTSDLIDFTLGENESEGWVKNFRWSLTELNSRFDYQIWWYSLKSLNQYYKTKKSIDFGGLFSEGKFYGQLNDMFSGSAIGNLIMTPLKLRKENHSLYFKNNMQAAGKFVYSKKILEIFDLNAYTSYHQLFIKGFIDFQKESLNLGIRVTPFSFLQSLLNPINLITTILPITWKIYLKKNISVKGTFDEPIIQYFSNPVPMDLGNFEDLKKWFRKLEFRF